MPGQIYYILKGMIDKRIEGLSDVWLNNIAVKRSNLIGFVSMEMEMFALSKVFWLSLASHRFHFLPFKLQKKISYLHNHKCSNAFIYSSTIFPSEYSTDATQVFPHRIYRKGKRGQLTQLKEENAIWQTAPDQSGKESCISGLIVQCEG